MWYVYILEIKKRQLYIGVTKNIERCMNEHKEGKVARFTRIFGFKKLVYYSFCLDRSQALKRDAQIKSWSQQKKITFIQNNSKK